MRTGALLGVCVVLLIVVLGCSREGRSGYDFEGGWTCTKESYKQGLYFASDGTGILFLDGHQLPMRWKYDANYLDISYSHYEEGIDVDERFNVRVDKVSKQLSLGRTWYDLGCAAMDRAYLELRVGEE